MTSGNELPKYAFAIKKSAMSKVLTTDEPKVIKKHFWSKYKPASCSSLKTSTNSNTSSQDLYDHGSFQQILKMEQSLSALILKYVQDPNTGYILSNYKSQQVTLSIRQNCFQWLIDIAVERDSDPNVVFHAMALFDKLLILKDVPKDYAQLIAATAYLTASKLRESCPVLLEDLSMFMNRAYEPAEIKKFEVFMNLQLNWDLECVTPIPILQVLASSLVCSDLVGLMVEKSTDALYRVAANETFLVFEPSLLAASSLLYTMSHLAVSSEVSTVYDRCLNAVCEMLSVEKHTVAHVACGMKGIIDCEAANIVLLSNTLTPAKATIAGASSINKSHFDNDSKSNISPIAPLDMKF